MKIFKSFMWLQFFCLVMGNPSLFGSPSQGYDSEEEYKTHQKVSDTFFLKATKKNSLRNIIESFKKNPKNFQEVIDLSGYSSRTRILLFRELTAEANAAKNKTTKFNFKINNEDFSLTLKPNPRQPGDGIISDIGKTSEIYSFFYDCSLEQQEKTANELLKAREKVQHPSAYHSQINYVLPQVNGENINLEILNVLLDFEVARRLQKEQKDRGGTNSLDNLMKDFSNLAVSPESKRNNISSDDLNDQRIALDAVPVAAAIIGALKLDGIDKNKKKIPFSTFFKADGKDGDFNYGAYNAFEGKAKLERRSKAVKNILRARNFAKGNNIQNSSDKEVKEEYYEIFGGESESSSLTDDTTTTTTTTSTSNQPWLNKDSSLYDNQSSTVSNENGGQKSSSTDSSDEGDKKKKKSSKK